MSGFPNRPGRSAFGAQMKDRRPISDPTREMPAVVANLLFWQVAGAGRTLPLAMILYDGVAQRTLHRAFAFDPDAKLQLGATRLGVGSYRVQFAGSYPDQNGRMTAFTLRAGIAIAQSALATAHAVASLSGQTLNIGAFVGTTPTDMTVLIHAW